MKYELKESDIYALVSFLGIRTRQRGDELQLENCPYCHSGAKGHDKWSSSINTKTGLFKCLRDSCGMTGNMVTLSRDFNFSLGAEFEEYIRPRKQYRKLTTPKEPIKPKQPAVEYMKSRGISEAITSKYELTVQKEHDNILVFPFYDEKGIMQFVKYRKTDFDKTRDKNKEWCETGCKPILFGMKQCEDFERLVVTEGQCFDGDAEILTKQGWVRFEIYAGQDVLQVNNDLSACFVRPSRYIVKRHTGQMVQSSIGGNYYTSTTDDHNLVFQDGKGNLIKKRACEKISTAYHIPTAISFDGGGLKWDNNMIALFLAVSADGTMDYRKNSYYRKAKADRYIRFAFQKKRKSDRLINILKALNINYSHSVDARGYDSICFPCPDWLNSKYLPIDFITKTSIEQKKFIIEEMVNWDGNHVNNRNQYEFVTTIKHNADIIQGVASTCGYMSTIMLKNSGGNKDFKKGFTYKVSVLLGKKNVSTQQFEKHKKFVDVDKLVYCVTVASGMLLVRQKGRISVSGNCDSLSVAEAGIKNAVSVPTGSKGFTWIPYCWDWMRRFKEIVVFGDLERGKMSLLEDIRKRFPNTIKAVREEDYRGCKDANEILQKYGREAVKEAVERAHLLPVKRVKQLADVEKVDIYSLPKLKTGIVRLDRLLNGGMHFGQVVIIAGKRGDGKSTFAGQIVANAIEQNYKSLVYSGEMPDYLYKSWMDFQIAGPDFITENTNIDGTPNRFITNSRSELINAWYRDKCFIYDSSIIDDDEGEDLLKTIEKAVMQYGIKVVLIDNLMTAIDLDIDRKSDKYDRQSNFTKKLAKLALTYDLIILLVAHRRKNGGGNDANDEVSGSADITNLAGTVLSYDRDRDLPDMQRKLIVSKYRLTGKLCLEGYILDYDEKSKRIYGEDDNLYKNYGWNTAYEEEETPFD